MSEAEALERQRSADLTAAPAFDEVNERRLDLIRKTVAKGASDAEIASFLELASKYGLDPFAKEIWCAKGKGKDGQPGRLLIMVGRDGLRKIAERNGLLVDGDVVRENDSFRVERKPDGTRGVTHSYEGDASKRGAITGAWCEVLAPSSLMVKGNDSGYQGLQAMPPQQRGFFFAPLHEYKPKNENQLRYSPWGAQESVMILAAAERQALRQATPLSGLLVEGEADRNIELLEAAPAEGLPLPDEVEDVLALAASVGHEGLADRATAEMALANQPPEKVEEWVRNASVELHGMEKKEDDQRATDAAMAAEGLDLEPPRESVPTPTEAEVEPAPDPEPDASEEPQGEEQPALTAVEPELAICGAEDPRRDGVTCERDAKHSGPHLAEGMDWVVASSEDASHGTPGEAVTSEGASQDSPAAESELGHSAPDDQSPEPEPTPEEKARALSQLGRSSPETAEFVSNLTSTHFTKKDEAVKAARKLRDGGYEVKLRGSRGDWTVLSSSEPVEGKKPEPEDEAKPEPESNPGKTYSAEDLHEQARAKVADANAAFNDGDEAAAEKHWAEAEKLVAEADALKS